MNKSTNDPYQIFPLGDAALLLSFGNEIDLSINKKVLNVFRNIKALQLPYILDVVPAYASLAIHYDVNTIHASYKVESSYQFMVQLIQQMVMNVQEEDAEKDRFIQIPVCYAPAFALDTADIIKANGLSFEEFIHIHTSTIYTVYMIGFLPGFPYMGKVDSRIAIPRKKQPRRNVEAGSVGIAGEQTGIYPLNSPGGWQIVGRTPISLFRKDAADPVLLKPGDQVQFYSITEHEFKNY